MPEGRDGSTLRGYGFGSAGAEGVWWWTPAAQPNPGRCEGCACGRGRVDSEAPTCSRDQIHAFKGSESCIEGIRFRYLTDRIQYLRDFISLLPSVSQGRRRQRVSASHRFGHSRAPTYPASFPPSPRPRPPLSQLPRLMDKSARLSLAKRHLYRSGLLLSSASSIVTATRLSHISGSRGFSGQVKA